MTAPFVETVTAGDGVPLCMHAYEPERAARGVIQVLHGLGEHAGRYSRLAAAANRRGWALCVHDQRGHGADAEIRGHFADEGGWHRLVADAASINVAARSRWPGQPLVLLGHSMGSFVAQSFAMHYDGAVDLLALSASTWPSKLEVLPGWLMARLEAWRIGGRGHSTLLDGLGFGRFNRPFLPARTRYDWLSRDGAEVDRYVADPLCGGPFTSRLWLDLLGGLLEISSDDALRRIPATLPILILGGGRDPVGGETGMTRLAMHYAQTGHQRITVRIFEDGRHEMLNEINRDEVTGVLIDWCEANRPRRPR